MANWIIKFGPLCLCMIEGVQSKECFVYGGNSRLGRARKVRQRFVVQGMRHQSYLKSGAIGISICCGGAVALFNFCELCPRS